MAHHQKQQENWSVLLVLDTRFLRSSFTPARTPRGNSSSTFGTMTAPPCAPFMRAALAPVARRVHTDTKVHNTLHPHIL